MIDTQGDPKPPALLPCPFCGVLPTSRIDAGSTWGVTCEEAECGYAAVYDFTQEGAEGIWNTRRPSIAVPDTVLEAAAYTTDRPTKPGVYWFLEPGEKDTICDVVITNNGAEVEFFGSSGCVPVDIIGDKCLWAGPITHPRKAEAT